jgi:hypothetical protein
MIPWGLIETRPSLVVIVPFLWFLWQIYVPLCIEWLVGRDDDGYLYETWWTKTKRDFKSEFHRLDDRVDTIGSDVEAIRETQEDLVNVTVAQSHLLNGSEGDIDVESVEDTLLGAERDRPKDYLNEDADE